MSSPFIVVGTASTSSQQVHDLAHDLVASLNLHSIAAIHSVVCAATSRLVFRKRLKLVLSATIYIPIIEPAWLAFEDSFVELYYVLRNFVLNSTPMIIPLVKGESSEMLNSSADGKKKALLDGLRQSCFHLCWDCSAMEMAVKLVNLLREIGESIPTRSVAVGVPLVDLYREQFKDYSDHRPNSGIVRVLTNLALPGTPPSSCASCSSLDLSNLLIADAGCGALGALLQMLPRLTSLNLRGNGIENKGVAALCTTLTRHPSLTSIDLSDNGFSQAGVADLLLAARENPHLQRVDVTGCACYSAVWIRRLTQQAEENAKFTSEHTLQPQEAAELVALSLRIEASFQMENKGCMVRIEQSAPLAATTAEAVGPRSPAPFFTSPFIASCDASSKDTALRNLWDTARKYPDFVVGHQLTISRMNGKSLKFALESSQDCGLEHLWRLALAAVSKTLPAIAQSLSQQDYVLHVRFVGAATPSDPFFTEASMELRHGKVTGKSLVQLFRENMPRFSGNMADELLALLAESAKAPDNHGKLTNIAAADDDAERQEDKTVEQAVVAAISVE